MNDTFEDFNFTQDVKIQPGISLESASDYNIKNNLNSNNGDISLDDSIFLSQNFLSQAEPNKTKPLIKNDFLKSKNGTKPSKFSNFNSTCNKENMGEKKRNLNSSKAGNMLALASHTDINKDSEEDKPAINKLSSWGLPKNVLEKYESKNLKFMFPWQVECLTQCSILSGKNLVYSAPTSAGKTLIAEILAIKTITELKKKVIFILPFVSIVREKMFYLQNLLGVAGIRVDGFMGSYNPPGGFGSIHFAVCTIEKANSLINRLLEEGKLGDIGAVLIDEMHLLGDPSRGYLLELLLTKLRYISKKEKLSIQIIGMSATLPNLDQIAKWLDAELYTTDFRPVPLNERVYVCGEIYDKHITLIRKLNLLPELKNDSDNILQLCLETIKESCSVLIFCPTKNWCESLAQQIATGFCKIGTATGEWSALLRSQLDTNLIVELLEQLKYCPVGLDEILQKTVSFGVAFHHAGLTMDERDIIEGAFRNGALRVLVATSTLSSGVNLPARRVIIRSPIFHGKPLDSLLYRQMIGRAGRMGKDTIGESFLICQKADHKIAKDLMSAELTSVKSCLKTSGKLERAILEVVASGVASSPQDVQLFTDSTLLATESADMQELKSPIEDAITYLVINEFIRLQKQEDGAEKYVPSSLGRACLSSSVAPNEGLSLFTELERARQCLVLETELHLIYLVTPYSACYSWENIDWMLYLNLWEKLPANMKKVGELVGIREIYLINAMRKKVQTNTGQAFHKYLVHKRFFISLALQDLVNEKPLGWVCKKFNCNRGMLQSLQQSASSFAGMVTAFSRKLGWTSMELLLSQFQDRMQFGVSRDLLDLMHLPVLNGKMARSMFNAGIETVVQLANSDIHAVENILHCAIPFESGKDRAGESDFQKRQRNKYKNVWINGREGLTEREAAEIFVLEARKYLTIEMGLVDAKWKDHSLENKATNIETTGDLSCSIDKANSRVTHLGKTDHRDLVKQNELLNNTINTKEKTDVEISENATKNESNESNTSKRQEDSRNNFKMSQMNEKSNVDEFSSDNSSIFSNNLNISDSSIISNQDSIKIENDVEDDRFFQEASNKISEKFQKFTIYSPKKSNLSFKADKKDVSSLLKEISLSDFSETFSESAPVLNKTEPPQKPINVSKLLNDSLELNISASSSPIKISNSSDNTSSLNDPFGESFPSFNDCPDEGFEEKEKDPYLKATEPLEDFKESFHSDEDLFTESAEEDLSFSARKRKQNSFEEIISFKKLKTREETKLQTNELLNKTYILNELNDRPVTDFSKMEIVNVSDNLTLLEGFSKELAELNSFSFSVACSKLLEEKSTIGFNILNADSLKRNVRSEEQTNMFASDERKVEGFSFSWQHNVVYYLSLGNVKLHQKIIKLLKLVFKNDIVSVSMFDSKEQIKILQKCCGINFFCKVDDPKVVDWILDPEVKEKNLKAMVLKYCPEGTELSQLSGGCKGLGSVGLDLYSKIESKIRSSLEAVLTWHLTANLKRTLSELNTRYLKIHETENEVLVILAKTELNGISLNKTKLTNLLEKVNLQIKILENKAYALAGRKFNFTSSTDVAKVTDMFRGRKVSTRKQILEKNQHPISDLVLKWRKLHSIQTKTIYPLMRAIRNDRIYGSYVTHTATGRISMHEPNIQNIAKHFYASVSSSEETDTSISCREVFEVPDGFILVTADFCQLELRILAHFSQDKLLCRIMKEPGDVFKTIAAKWNKIGEEEVTDDLRQNAKQLCYGIIYGMGCRSLAEQLNIQETEAIEFMESFKNTYPGMKTFCKQTLEICRKCGYVETVNGRKRFLPHINDAEQAKRGQAERQAVNTIIQGSAADIVKGAMLKVERELEQVFNRTKNKPKLVLFLHDELIYEVPNKYLWKVAKIIKQNMENSVEMSIPFPVKLKSGKSWGSLTELIL